MELKRNRILSAGLCTPEHGKRPSLRNGAAGFSLGASLHMRLLG